MYRSFDNAKIIAAYLNKYNLTIAYETLNLSIMLNDVILISYIIRYLNFFKFL